MQQRCEWLGLFERTREFVFYGICAAKSRQLFDSSELAWPCGLRSCCYHFFIFLSLISIIILFVSSHTILFASNRECRFGDQLTLQFWRLVVEFRSNPFFNFVFPLQIVICRMFGRWVAVPAYAGYNFREFPRSPDSMCSVAARLTRSFAWCR